MLFFARMRQSVERGLGLLAGLKRAGVVLSAAALVAAFAACGGHEKKSSNNQASPPQSILAPTQLAAANKGDVSSGTLEIARQVRFAWPAVGTIASFYGIAGGPGRLSRVHFEIHDRDRAADPLRYLASQQSLYGSDLGTQKCGSAGSSIDIEPASTVRFSLGEDFSSYSVARASIGTVDG